MPDALATEMDRVLLGRTKDMKELTVSNSVVSTQWDNPIAFYFLPFLFLAEEETRVNQSHIIWKVWRVECSN